MATVGGNLLQRTRCLYFRDPTVPCNKRQPGSGCPAQDGLNRINAIFGGSEHCIAAYPGDMAVALLALDANLVVQGVAGERRISLADLYRLPGDTPQRETTLEPGELITAVLLPRNDAADHSHYLKLRDRASFEWALVSVAVALEMDGRHVRQARVFAGGVGTKPWRLAQVEEAVQGSPLTPELARHAGDLAQRRRSTASWQCVQAADATARRGACPADRGRNRMNAIIGQPISRVDGPAKVTGQAIYAAEFNLRNMAYAALVHSTIARGRIERLDATSAEQAPGVLAVISHLNAERLPYKSLEKRPPVDPKAGEQLHVFQGPEILFVGQPVAVVVAETAEQAREAAALVQVVYHEAAAATELQQNDAQPPTEASAKAGRSGGSRGDAATAFTEAPVKVDMWCSHEREHHNAMEPHATIAEWDGDHLTLYDKSQWVDNVRSEIAHVFGMPEENIRVISPFVGGAFGSALRTWPHVTIAASGGTLGGTGGSSRAHAARTLRLHRLSPTHRAAYAARRESRWPVGRDHAGRRGADFGVRRIRRTHH